MGLVKQSFKEECIIDKNVVSIYPERDESKLYQDRVYCNKCGNLLGYFKKDNPKYKKDKIICLACENLYVIKKEIVLDYLEYEKFLTEKIFQIFLEFNDQKRCIKTILNLRETQGSYYDQNFSTEPSVTATGGIVISINYLILMDLAIGLFLENYINVNTSQNGFDASEFAKIIHKYQKIFQQIYSIKQNKSCMIKISDDYYNFNYTFSDEYIPSLEQFGLTRRNLNSEENSSKIMKIAEELEDRDNITHNLYLVSIMLRGAISINFPERSANVFSFDQFDDFIKKLIHDFIAYMEYKYKDKVGKTQSDLANNQNFFISLSLNDFFLDFKDHILKSHPINSNLTDESIKEIFEKIKRAFISSKYNNIMPPIFVCNIFDSKIYFGPNSLFFYRSLLEASIEWLKIKSHFDEWCDNRFFEKIFEILKSCGINCYDDSLPNPFLLREIKNKKNDGFEIDIYGRKDDILFLFELKSFRPSPFFDSIVHRKSRFNRCDHFEAQIFNPNKAYNFWQNISLKSLSDPNGFWNLNLRKKNHKTGKFESIRIKFKHNFPPKFIVPIFVNQLSELPNSKNYKINLVIQSELRFFLQNQKLWKKYRL
ncbi:MAG: hypothetical protein K9W44_06640 [Candidatus Lokiarchaeota archaeon]|nr:hypothetical protein [Candidatus Harpocratesius repetitus]